MLGELLCRLDSALLGLEPIESHEVLQTTSRLRLALATALKEHGEANEDVERAKAVILSLGSFVRALVDHETNCQRIVNDGTDSTRKKLGLPPSIAPDAPLPVAAMRAWFIDNIAWPYPTVAQRRSLLGHDDAVKMQQVLQWCQNMKKRSQWAVFWREHARSNRMKMQELVTMLESPITRWLVDAKIAQQYDVCKAYIAGEKPVIVEPVVAEPEDESPIGLANLDQWPQEGLNSIDTILPRATFDAITQY